MDGVALFLWTPTKDKRKEYILDILQKKFEEQDIETIELDLSLPDAFVRLNEIGDYFLGISFEKKHFVFSLDGEGFDLKLRVDGLWVDNIRYNFFTYLTKHPQRLTEKLSGINSWYISILMNAKEWVSYVEETYPHLEGTEVVLFPAFMGKYAELPSAEREYDIFVIAEYSKDNGLLLEKLAENNIRVLVYGEGWEKTAENDTGHIVFVPEEERIYQNQLDFMGQSRIVWFIHTSADEFPDIDVISAMANGAVVFTEKTEDWSSVFLEDQEILFYTPEQFLLLPERFTGLLSHRERLTEISEAGKRKAGEKGEISRFVKQILERCK